MSITCSCAGICCNPQHNGFNKDGTISSPQEAHHPTLGKADNGNMKTLTQEEHKKYHSPQEDWEDSLKKRLLPVSRDEIVALDWFEASELIEEILFHKQKRNADLKRKIEEMKKGQFKFDGMYLMALDDVLAIIEGK